MRFPPALPFLFPMDAILELRNLVKDFPGQQAVAGISLSVPRGSFFSLVGPSGCGKTTTLRLIAGFEQPDLGRGSAQRKSGQPP